MTQPRQPRRYAIFRHRTRSDLCCAIVEGTAAPAFIDEETWLPAGTLDVPATRPTGFDEDAAAFSCALQGFYVFSWGRDRRSAPNSGIFNSAA